MLEYERRDAYRAWPFLSEEDKNDLRWLSIMAGRPIKERDTTNDLTEWESVQADFDDIWWHRKSVLSLMDGVNCPCCIRYGPKPKSILKAKSMSFRSNWGDNNAKRKTLRTHRDGSRRNYRLRPRAVE